MTETFRLRKSVKYQGMAFAAIFLAALIWNSSVFFLEEPAKHGFKREHSVAILGGMGLIVYGGMLLMSICMWVAYYLERFTINGTTISIRSMLQRRQFEISEITYVKWRVHPVGGSIHFHFLSSKARMDLHGYSKYDRLRIVRALHDLLPPQVQEGWPQFCHKVALPLRNGKPSISHDRPSSNLQRRTLFVGLSALASSLLVMVGLPLLGVRASIAVWTACALMGAALPIVVYLLYKIEQQQGVADEHEAVLAPARWQQMESSAANVDRDINSKPTGGTQEAEL